ncbi:hypothetical protein H8D91_00060 [archaeon]|nr:hypothetical protein [archaeon]
MGDFRSFERSGGRDSRGGDRRNFSNDRREGGRSYGGRDSGSRGGSFGGRDRRELPFCDAVCAKCGKDCKVPFKPTGDKPVYCRSCFNGGDNDGSSDRRDSGRNMASASQGVTQEQFKQLSKKVDQILEILNTLEDEEYEEEE